MKRVSDSNNPHVLKMIGCVTTTLPTLLVMQFVPHGSLKDYLRAMTAATEVKETAVCNGIKVSSCVGTYIQFNLVNYND